MVFWKRWFDFGKNGKNARKRREHLEQTKDAIPGFPIPGPRKPKEPGDK